MQKVTIKGEVFSFDENATPLAEAIILEEELGMTYGQWRQALTAGSAKAAAGYVWLVLHRNGRTVPFADIISGKFALNDEDLKVEAEGEAEDGNPTGDLPSSEPTGGVTSGSSPKRSGSGRGRSQS